MTLLPLLTAASPLPQYGGGGGGNGGAHWPPRPRDGKSVKPKQASPSKPQTFIHLVEDTSAKEYADYLEYLKSQQSELSMSPNLGPVVLGEAAQPPRGNGPEAQLFR